jgi:hypothetical protein
MAERIKKPVNKQSFPRRRKRNLNSIMAKALRGKRVPGYLNSYFQASFQISKIQ